VEAIPAEADNESRNYRADAEQGGQKMIENGDECKQLDK
jgi:hypothetical protein